MGGKVEAVSCIGPEGAAVSQTRAAAGNGNQLCILELDRFFSFIILGFVFRSL